MNHGGLSQTSATLLVRMATLIPALWGCAEFQPGIEGLEKVVLLDVQGLWGGRDLWMDGKGKATCRFVAPRNDGKPGLLEKRYTFVASKTQLDALAAILRQHRFTAIRTNQRMGNNDEARPCIYVESRFHDRAVAKWINDAHADFDPIYHYLQAIADSGRSGKQIYEGAFVWGWHPAGYPEHAAIHDAARRDPQ